MAEMCFTSIGTVRSPHTSREGAPIQPTGAQGVRGHIDINPEFQAGVKDLDGFSHIFVLYHCHLSQGYDLEVVPFMDTEVHGVFATRAPRRPNPIGLSVVRLLAVYSGRLDLADVDLLDGTPVLDIKPFVPDFDVPAGEVRTGWLAQNAEKAETLTADDRFTSRDYVE